MTKPAPFADDPRGLAITRFAMQRVQLRFDGLGDDRIVWHLGCEAYRVLLPLAGDARLVEDARLDPWAVAFCEVAAGQAHKARRRPGPYAPIVGQWPEVPIVDVYVQTPCPDVLDDLDAEFFVPAVPFDGITRLAPRTSAEEVAA